MLIKSTKEIQTYMKERGKTVSYPPKKPSLPENELAIAILRGKGEGRHYMVDAMKEAKEEWERYRRGY